ncbi:unnamed protein product [Hanseniaspora opuntiae]|jgi:hypothetical protein
MSDININDSIKDNNDYQYIKVDNVTKDLDIIINDLTEVLPLRTNGVVNDRRYKCLKCLKFFKRHEHLKRHIITHTGEKLYKCNYHMCIKKFSRSDEVKRHYKTHLNSYIMHNTKAVKKPKKNEKTIEKNLLNLDNKKVSLPPIYNTPISSSNNFLNNLMNNAPSLKQYQPDSNGPMISQSFSNTSMTNLNMLQVPNLTPGTLNTSPLVINNMQQPFQGNLFNEQPMVKLQSKTSNWISNSRPASSAMPFNNQSSMNLNALNLMPLSQKSNLPNMSVTSMMTINDKQGYQNNSSTNLLSLPLSKPLNTHQPSSGLSKMGSLNQLNLLGGFGSSVSLANPNISGIKSPQDKAQDDDVGLELVIKGKSQHIINKDDYQKSENKSSISNSASPSLTGKKLPSLKDIFN